jgi:hypothetical protein
VARPDFLSDRYGFKRPLRFSKKLSQWQREAPLGTPIARRIDMWRRGYQAASYTLYDLSPAHADEYLPDSARLDIFFINGPFAREVLEDKLLFASLLQHHLPIPQTLALIERGETYALGQRAGILDLAREHGSVILRPSDGTRGGGVYRLEAHAGLSLNNRATTPDDVKKLVARLDNYLVTETIQQAAYARAIYPESANTLRIMTFTDPDTGEPFIACALHRFGTPDSSPTDNWSRGGLISLIDLQTGIVGPGLKHIERTGGNIIWQSHHPDTGAAIEGVRIPRWREVCEALLDAVRSFPFLIYVGWDVVVTEEGFAILEGNKNPDIIVQVHGGWLKDPRMRRFYEYHKVI